MIHLNSIELKKFKGIMNLRCEFDDFTLLAGLNNSGKTTILQAVYLLFAALRPIAEHPNNEHLNETLRIVSLPGALSPLGLRDTSWLFSQYEPEVTGTITGKFSNDLTVEIGMIHNQPNKFLFTVTHAENVKSSLDEIKDISAAILTPPGDVPTHENMVSGDQYQSLMREGKGSELWRNGLWWAIQESGFESFAPVQEQISKYFPEVELLLPSLSTTGNSEILIKYKEHGRGPLDIAQSGAGLRTFISLARILEQSQSNVVLLDEPDAHLHASQQSTILDLILDVAITSKRQVIIASHSPEIITRVPSECIRWVDRNQQEARGGFEVARILDEMGVSADTYIPPAELPDILVYVEGVDDRPIIEALIKRCRDHHASKLPTTLVVPHRDGRFEGPTLQGIARVVQEMQAGVSVVGIRDLDWYYCELPKNLPDLAQGKGWTLLTLPCKEMENLFCESTVLFQAYDQTITEEALNEIIDFESVKERLIDEWAYQVRPRIRKRLSNTLDPSTKEQKAAETFELWKVDPDARKRLVAGKALLKEIRHRIRQEHGKNFYPARALEKCSALTPSFESIANAIFPMIKDT